MSITASTTTLNRTELRQARRYDGSSPFHITTKKQFLEELAHSHQQTLNGQYKSIDKVREEVKRRYGF